ncbi:MAG: carboxypeptidase M32 [Azospirillum sp.]|nr:carboxypeptidase M32 [Azospirillum sp.]
MDAYRALEKRFTRLSAVNDAIGILDWDSQTMMPAGAAAGRAEQTATLRVIAHELLTDPHLGDQLGEAETTGGLEPWQAANLREMRRLYLHATAVPADLVDAASRTASACEMAWRSAKPASDFDGLRPLLQAVLDTQREIAAAKAAALGCGPYDALLDAYEPAGRSAEIAAVFDDLAIFLVDFLPRVLDYQASRPAVLPLSGPFDLEAQRQLGLLAMRAIGFDFQRGRLDVSLHPFCGGAEQDVRLTTRYEEDNFTRALMGVMHETGHALYEQGRPETWRGQPVGAARGMAMHESQSLIVEMQAGRGRAFLGFLAPVAAATFGGAGPAWTADNLARIFTQVRRSLIRVDADEVTYPAHVILRFRLEKAMIEGDLALADLPGAWNDGMAALLGVVPPDHRRGCLQDIHWPGGAWGYFPTYTLGAMIAAQLFDTAQGAEPDLVASLGRGDFSPLRRWLERHVHAQGSFYPTPALLTEATGRPLDVAVFKRHLERRYLDA